MTVPFKSGRFVALLAGFVLMACSGGAMATAYGYCDGYVTNQGKPCSQACPRGGSASTMQCFPRAPANAPLATVCHCK